MIKIGGNLAELWTFECPKMAKNQRYAAATIMVDTFQMPKYWCSLIFAMDSIYFSYNY